MKRIIRRFGFAAIAAGILSWLAETVFYGDIDSNGVLQESLFLPLAFLFAIMGIILVVVSFFMRSPG